MKKTAGSESFGTSFPFDTRVSVAYPTFRHSKALNNIEAALRCLAHLTDTPSPQPKASLHFRLVKRRQQHTPDTLPTRLSSLHTLTSHREHVLVSRRAA